MTRVALDSNVLAYLAGVCRSAADDAKIARMRALAALLAQSATLIAPTQTLGELFVVLRKGGASPAEAREILVEFAEAFGSAPSDKRIELSAADLVVDHQLQFWDSLIIAAAAEAGCTMLLSEDMQHGFVARGLTIVNPLIEPPHPKLAALTSAEA